MHRPASAFEEVATAGERGGLPRWPVTLSLVGFPLWWLLGLGESAWVLFALVMVVLLAHRGGVQVPKWFGLWLLFLLWVLCSGIGVDSSGRLLGFVYRTSVYLAVTVFMVYVYNGQETLSHRYISGVLSVFWLIVVFGGFLGLALPLLEVKTLAAYVMPPSLASNELVHDMIYRRVTQFNPNATQVIRVRPSAPFLYTNGWGNAYSLLLPIVLAFLGHIRRERKFWLLLLAVPVSAVPALLTLNRGMGIGLGIALVYGTYRLARMGQVKLVAGLVTLAVVLALVGSQLPVIHDLNHRLQVSSTTEDRLTLYIETFQRTMVSPIFGYGGPRPSAEPGLPSVGTQGELWTLMFSYGFPAVLLFYGYLLTLFLQTLRLSSALGLVTNIVIVVIAVQSTYYGVEPDGVIIVMILAGLALRQPMIPEMVSRRSTALPSR